MHADELRFKQVVLNLASNAVKFTPDGGAVDIRAQRTADEVVVTVTDTGVGIPPEDRERIFESFQQGGRGVAREEGTGLGLTLSRRIVELFDGRLWLESQVGAGSTFGFSLPLAPSRRRVAGDGTAYPTLLLVDDDRASLDLVAAYLEGAPVRLERAYDGEEALRSIAAATPAAVVLDIRLPKLDGWSVLERLRADPATAAVPVVVVVGRRRARARAGAGRDRLPDQAGQPRRPGRRARARRRTDGTDARGGGDMTRRTHPGGRGQPAEPQAGQGRARRRRATTSWRRRPGRRACGSPQSSRRTWCSWTSSCPASTAPRRCTGCGRTVARTRMPVVAVTAFAMAEDHVQAEKAGFDAYVEKPISIRGLVRQVRELLDEVGHE